MVHVGDAPAERILDGYHGERRRALRYGGEGVLEAFAWHGLEIRIGLVAGEM